MNGGRKNVRFQRKSGPISETVRDTTYRVFTRSSKRPALHLLEVCYRKILRIGWTQKVTNEELYRKIQLAETLLQKVIQRKLRLFGHICRMNDSRKIKTLVFGMMDGSNNSGRPHREWSDDIEQWCGATYPAGVKPVRCPR